MPIVVIGPTDDRTSCVFINELFERLKPIVPSELFALGDKDCWAIPTGCLGRMNPLHTLHRDSSMYLYFFWTVPSLNPALCDYRIDTNMWLLSPQVWPRGSPCRWRRHCCRLLGHHSWFWRSTAQWTRNIARTSRPPADLTSATLQWMPRTMRNLIVWQTNSSLCGKICHSPVLYSLPCFAGTCCFKPLWPPLSFQAPPSGHVTIISITSVRPCLVKLSANRTGYLSWVWSAGCHSTPSVLVFSQYWQLLVQYSSHLRLGSAFSHTCGLPFLSASSSDSAQASHSTLRSLQPLANQAQGPKSFRARFWCFLWHLVYLLQVCWVLSLSHFSTSVVWTLTEIPHTA